MSTSQRFAQEFTKYLDTNFSRQEVGSGYLRNELTKIRRLDSLARIFNGTDSQNCTAVCLYQEKLYVASNKDIFNCINGIVAQIKSYFAAGKLPVRTRARSNRDMRKLVSSISGIGKRRLYHITASGNTSKKYYYENVYVMASLATIFADTDNNIVKIPNNDNLHAELCVMNYLINNGLYQPFNGDKILFGISKLCCKLCACGMNATGLNDREHYRAIHGNFYNKWIMPEYIKVNPALLNRFLGQESYSIYCKHTQEQADLLEMVPIKLGIDSGRGASSSAFSDSEVD